MPKSSQSIWTLLTVPLFILQLWVAPAQAQRGVDTLNVSTTLNPDTSGDYSIVGRGSPSTPLFPATETFNLIFNTSIGNTSLDSFSIAGTNYARITNADEVFVRREGNANSSTQRFRYFAEAEVVGNDINIRPTRPNDIRDIVLSNIINRGLLDFFRNDDLSLEHANNVERLDVVFTQGLTAPAIGLDEAGFIQIEKSGNNPFQIAAITAIDGAGNPTAYGPLIMVAPADYSLTNVATANIWFENDIFDTPPGSGDHGLPGPLNASAEALGGVFISLQDLGITASQTFFGYSTMADDVDPNIHNLLDPSTFPQDTGGPIAGGNGADFHGGTAGYFASSATETPSIGVAKEVRTIVGNAVTLSLHIENYGSVPLTNLSLVDDLDQTFGAGNYTVSSAPMIITPPATSTLQLNAGYTGAAGPSAELLDSANSSLAVGEFAKMEFTVTITTITDQGNGLGVYLNSATGAGDPPTGPANRVTDDSTSGPDPDVDGDNGDGSTDGDNIPNENTPTAIIIGINQPPTAVDDSVTTPLDTPVTFSATGNDSDSDGTIDPATIDLDPATPGRQTAFTVAGEGTFTVDSSGNVTFIPNPGFIGTSTTPYTVNDNDGGTSNVANLSVTVQASPTGPIPPVAANDRATTPVDTPVTLSVTANDSDSDGTIAPASVDLDLSAPGRQTTRAVPGEGTYTVNDSGDVTFTPEPGFTGTSTIPYTVNDNDDLTSNAATVSITVGTSLNNPPVAVDDSETTTPETPVTVPVLDNDSDPDGDTLMVVQVTQPPSGTATINPDGTITYTPAPDTVGPVMFPYMISDGRGGTATAVVTINLIEGFDPPIGLKVADARALPQIEWTMLWINTDNATATAVRVTDDVPAGTTYVEDSLACISEGASTVDLCEFDAAANRVVYEGMLVRSAPALRIVYRVAVPPDFIGDIENQAEANWDANGNGSVDDDISAGQTRVVTDDPSAPGGSDPTVVTIEPPDGGNDDNDGDGTEGGDDPSEGGIDTAKFPRTDLSQ